MSRRPILVVEDQAHFAFGHYPQGVANLAGALAALDCDVRVLTSRGWVGGDGGGAFRVERFGWPTAALWAAADALTPSMSRTRWTRTARWRAGATAAARATAIALAVRRSARRHAVTTRDVILYSHDVHAFVLAALVGRGRFVHHAFRAPPGDRPLTVVGRLLDRAVRRREAARRRVGEGFRVAAATASLVDAWTRRAPFLDPVLIPHGMSREEPRVDDARERFGIANGDRVALVFGADHGNKDLATVWRAFRELPDWTLLVVGHVADAFRAWAVERDAFEVPDAITVGGYVDGVTRASAYSAADVVVLSFDAAHVRDSGVLLDALTFRRPVVCSDGTDAAAKVREFGLGTVFDAGDPSALAAALRTVARTLPDGVAERALVSTSDAAVARAHLDALDQLGRK